MSNTTNEVHVVQAFNRDTASTWDVAAYEDYNEAVDHAADIEVEDESGTMVGRVTSVTHIA